MARKRCNELCTKEATDQCALCDALDERDRFERFWFKGGLFIDGVRALKRGKMRLLDQSKVPGGWLYPVPRVGERHQDVVDRLTPTLIIMQDGLKQLSSSSEDASKVIRFCALLSTIFGAYYFLAYMIHHGLPFPLELTILPTVLLAIGIGSILLISLIILYLFLAAFVHWDPLDVDYPVLIYTNSHGIFAPSRMVLLINWVLIYGGPISIWLLLLFQDLLPKGQVGVYLIPIGSLIWAILFGVAKVQVDHSRLGRSKWVTALKISVTTFLVLLLGSFSTILFMFILYSRGLLETVGRQFFSSLFFLSLNFSAMATFVVPSAISLESADETEEKLDAKKLTGRLFKSRNPILFGFILAMTLLPDIAPYVGEIPLKLLNIGGGVERLFYLGLLSRRMVCTQIPAGEKPKRSSGANTRAKSWAVKNGAKRRAHSSRRFR